MENRFRIRVRHPIRARGTFTERSGLWKRSCGPSTDPADLAAKYREAGTWFDEVIETVDEAQVRRDVAGISK
jgi:hypothetical protein